MRIAQCAVAALLALGAACAARAQEEPAGFTPEGEGEEADVLEGLDRVPVLDGRGALLIGSPESWAPVAGVCQVTFDVNDFGRVIGSTIVADCTSPDLVDPAIGIAAGWRYEPPIVDGEPVAQTGMTAEVRFRQPG